MVRDDFDGKVIQEVEVIAVDVLNDERGLIGFDISVREREVACCGWEFGYEGSDCDFIVLWNGS